MPRFRITSLIVFVALIAGGLGAMRYGSAALAKTFTTLLLVAMLIGLTGAIILRKSAWIGFSVFVVGYAGPFSIGRRDGDLGRHTIESITEAFHPVKSLRPTRPKVYSPFLPETGSTLERSFLEEDLAASAVDLKQSTAELKLLQDFQKQLKTYLDEEDLAKPLQQNSMTIGNACLALALGWVGAIVGRLLEKRRSASFAPRPLDPQPTMTS